MKIQYIRLRNFKGIRDLEIKANGKSLNIYGTNETGKTTINDAISFILFNKDTLDRSPDNFGIKTREKYPDGTLGEHLHELEHSVEILFSGVPGRKTDELKLQKIYKETWTGCKSSKEKRLTGHEIVYYVDDVECKKAMDYKEVIDSIGSEEVLKILTIPEYFAGKMHWSDRRRVLKDYAGKISDQDVIDSDEGLNSYMEILENRDHDNSKKFFNDRRKKLLEQIDDVATRIDEASRQIVELDPEKVKESQNQIKALKQQISELDQQINKVKAGGGSPQLKVKISEKESEVLRLRNQHAEKESDALADMRKRVSELEDKLDTANTKFRDAKRAFDNAKSDVEKAVNLKQRIEQQIQIERAREFTEPSQSESCELCERSYNMECPSCHHEFSTGGESIDVQGLKKKFNSEKAEKIKNLQNDLNESQDLYNDAHTQMKDLEAKGANLSGKVKQAEQAVAKASELLLERKKSFTAFEETDAYKELQAVIEELQNKVDQVDSDIDKDVSLIQEKKQPIENDIEGLGKIIHTAESNERVNNRILELQQSRVKYRDELEECEHNLEVIKLFEITSSRIVTERVNKLFRPVTWQMFETQVNGDINPDVCEAVYKGVPFNEALNNAAKTQAGVIIINKLSEFYGVSLPLIIDERESVVELPEHDMQVISLYVSEKDKELRIEVA